MKPIKDPLLRLVQERYGERWRIRRTSHLWIAVPRDAATDDVPTVVEADVEEFVCALDDPPVSTERSLLSGEWFQDQLERIGDRVYFRGRTSMS